MYKIHQINLIKKIKKTHCFYSKEHYRTYDLHIQHKNEFFSWIILRFAETLNYLFLWIEINLYFLTHIENGTITTAKEKNNKNNNNIHWFYISWTHKSFNNTYLVHKTSSCKLPWQFWHCVHSRQKEISSSFNL